MLRSVLPLVFAGIALAACSPQPATEATPAAVASATHPVSGLALIRGLMFRTELGPDEGMIFPREPADVASFWMKNTPLPLDIIFIGTDHRIINIAANTTPYSLTPVNAAGMTAAVLEIRGGRAAELGIEPGAKVDW